MNISDLLNEADGDEGTEDKASTPDGLVRGRSHLPLSPVATATAATATTTATAPVPATSPVTATAPATALTPVTATAPAPATAPATATAQAETHSLPYPPSTSSPKAVAFQKPSLLLTFSYTADHALIFTDSALRYFVDPPIGARLDYGYERWVKRPEERGRLDALLKGWSRAGSAQAVGNVGVVTWRGVLTKILTAVYEDREEWEMNVMCVNSTLYLEEHLSEAKLKAKENISPHHRLQTYYGYAFESYCTSTTPTRHPNPRAHVPEWGGDVNTNVQWCAVAKTKLGSTRIILGGEVDCVSSTYVQNGSTDAFVELKTSMSIRNPQDEARFERKLLKFYFQSFLLGVPRIVVGFRTSTGNITVVQNFKTLEIPRLIRGKPNSWDPLLCLAWGDKLFEFLLSTMSRSDPNHVWRVTFIPHGGVKVRLLNAEEIKDVEGGEDRVGFLPSWYWDEVKTSSGGRRGRSASPERLRKRRREC